MLTNNNNFDNLINGEKPILVDFFAEWCGPCKTMAPILKQVKDVLQNNVTIIKIDVDKNPGIARKYAIQGVPTLIIFKEGAIKWRQSGVLSAKNLEQVLQQHL